jgi:predicted ATP-grasp superfamily ATP-dependent carboligase
LTAKRRPRVLLAGGDDRSLLAAVRSFAAHEIPFVVAGARSRGMVGISRYARRHLIEMGPSARSEPAAYGEFVADVVRRHGIGLVVPVTDSTLLACDRHRDAIERNARLAAAPSRALRNVLDKKANLATARELGIPCPAQFDLESVDEMPALVDALGFPMVLKNPGPSVDGRRRSFDFNWLVARDEAELAAHLARHCSDGEFPVFQRLVTGSVQNVNCFAVGGELVAVHEYRSLRRLGGLSVLREIVPLSPGLLRHCESMLAELRWDGVAQLAFFVREHDGDARYMETNGRFWASIEGSIAAGWDFPLWTYQHFALEQTPRFPPRSQGLGSRWRWHYGELEVLLRSLAGGSEATWAGTRAGAVAEYLAGFRPGIHADVFRLDDPLPEVVDHWRGGRLAALTGFNALRRRIGR